MIKKIIRIFIFCPLLLLAERISILPKPVSIEYLDGAFSITPLTKIIIQQAKNRDADQLQWIAQYVDNSFFGSDTTRKKYTVMSSKMMRPQRIVLSMMHYFKDLGTEGYKLSIFPDVIIISANSAQGIFYGVQSLLQIAKPVQIAGMALYYTVQGATITDYPRFAWRGLHIDAATNFISKQSIKNHIDNLALLKMNIFQWQFANNLAWKIEINKYPKLTENISFNGNNLSNKSYKDTTNNFAIKLSFYSQSDIKEIVDYAAQRYITIVPHIPMPTQAASILAAYPNLGCSQNSINSTTLTTNEMAETLCPNDSSSIFLNTILTELFALFPTSYIHIGAEKIPNILWRNSEFIKNLLLQNGYKNQSQILYNFIKNLEKFITLNGKKMIGYEDIIQANVSNKALIMNSKTETETVQAIQKGNNVVLTPKEYCISYENTSLDSTQKVINIKKIYSHNPLIQAYSYDHKMRILGIQGTLCFNASANIWSHNLAIDANLAALSECAWTLQNNKDYQDFETRFTSFDDQLKIKK